MKKSDGKSTEVSTTVLGGRISHVDQRLEVSGWKTKEPIEYQQTSGVSETEHITGGNQSSKTFFTSIVV